MIIRKRARVYTEARAAAAAAETAASAAEASAAAIQPYDSRADAIAALPDLADTITRVSWREGNAILSSVRQTGATEFAAGWAMARRENTFSLGDYLHEDDLSAALAGDLAGQDIDRVTAAVQAFHHAVFSYFDAVATTYSQVIVEYLPGLIAINDEMFSEATAQIIWDLGYKNQLAAITFDFKSLYVACDFDAYSAVRTSGYYAENSITYAVPKVAFRMMRSAISPANLAVFKGRLQIVGNNDFATDPVGVLLYNINGLTSDAEILARNMVQSGFVIESIFNSRLSNFRSNSGFVATEYGGDYGLIPKTATFSSVGTALTASEAVFDASHVGAWVWLSGAGPLNSDGGTYMPHGTTIAAYVSPTEVTLTAAPDRDVTGKRLSFEGITGTVADGGSTITMSKALTGDLVGRYVTLVGANNADQVGATYLYTATITAHSGDQITLSIPATVGVTDGPLIFSAALHASPTDVGAIDGGAAIDDVSFQRLWLEDGGYRNVSTVQAVMSGVHLDVNDDIKLHGSTTGNGNNWAGNIATMLCGGRTRGARFDLTSTHGGYSRVIGKHTFVGSRIDARLKGESNYYPATGNSRDLCVWALGGDPVRIVYDMVPVGFGGDGFESQRFIVGKGDYTRGMVVLPGSAPVSVDGYYPGAPTVLGEVQGLALAVARPVVGGTADAITLATGAGLTGDLPAGLQLRFRAAAANTGAATIAIDGGAPIACRTIRGTALPAGYIRDDVDTVAYYDGTYLVLDRAEESGVVAGQGVYQKFASGLLVCHQRLTGIDITTADGALYRSAALSWTFPEPFVLGNTNGARIGGTVVDTAGIGVTQQYPGAQASSGNIYAKATASITGKNVYLVAEGQWYAY